MIFFFNPSLISGRIVFHFFFCIFFGVNFVSMIMGCLIKEVICGSKIRTGPLEGLLYSVCVVSGWGLLML